MKITALNVGRGLYRKLDVIEAMLKTEEIDVLGLSEVDLQPGDVLPIIPGYDVFQQNTKGKVRVISYVKETLPAVQRETNLAMPVVFMEVGQVSVGFIYNDFTQEGERVCGINRLQRLEEMINEFEKGAKKTAVLLGDYNVNWCIKSKEKSFLQNWAAGSGFHQFIEGVTRSAIVGGEKQESNIDLIFGRGKVRSAWIQDPGLSDHCSISCHVTRGGISNLRHETIKETKVTLEIVRWARENPPLFSEGDSAGSLYRTLVTWMNNITNKCTVEKLVRRGKEKKPPWYTSELDEMKKLIAVLRGEDKKKARNNYVTEVRKARRKFERKKLEGSRRGLWEIVRKKHVNRDIELEEDGTKLKGKEAANKFAAFFEEKPKKLQQEPRPDRVKKLVKDRIGKSGGWELRAITEGDLGKVIDRLKAKKSVGPDNISYFMLKQFKFEVLPILVQIVNRSIEDGEFLSDWKIGRVIPLYKGKGKRSEVQSYRPVTLTSSVGRIVEMVIREQLEKHLEESDILSPRQYGFRKGRGTASCLVDCIDDIRKRMSKGHKVGLIALDASAAFEVIDRRLLREFVRMCGAGDGMLKWMDSYFEERRCYVDVQGQCSGLWEVEVGAVQGSPLSTTWYNIMSISQTLYNDFSSSYGYADDENEVVSATTATECEDLIQRAASGMVHWFEEIGLSMNHKKSEVVCFNFDMAPVEIAGHLVEPKREFRFLGLTIQSNMRWGSHVDHLCTSIRRSAGRIRVEGRHLNAEERTQLYSAWVGGKIHSNARAYIMSMTEGEINKLQAACNAAVRAVGGMPRRSDESVTIVRKKFGIMSVREIREYYEVLEAWEWRRKLGEESAERIRTRSATARNVVVPDQRGSRRFLSETVARLSWNKLPQQIREVNNRFQAKKLIKGLVLNH